MSDETTLNDLPAGTLLLRNQYQIERMLGDGGFGITYLARDSLDRQVVIKECFPEMLCCRQGRNVKARTASEDPRFQSVITNFLKEARRVAKLDHPNIVGVHQVFEENGTAYLAMDFIDGVDLLTLLEDAPEKLTRDVLQKALRDTLKSIKYIHDLEILHRDISPDNLMLDDAGNLTLIDFGAARDNCLRKDRALSALLSVKDGYSPHEFYLDDTDQKKSSDLYSLAATFYHLIIGQAPPDSQRRVAALASGKPDPYQPLAGLTLDFDETLLASIDTCLNIKQSDRLQTADEWLGVLDGTVPRQVQVAPTPAKRHTPKEPTRVRPAQEPAPRVEILVDSIAELVETTNRDVKKSSPKKNRKKKAKEEHFSVSQDSSVKQFVDLFGNPIHDVEAWMREQDELSSSKSIDTPAQSDFDLEDISEQDVNNPLRSLIRAMMPWRTRRKPLTAPTQKT
ncbi:serine/threonine protein kinase [Marivita hallyeonensis]|uniref:non-specific serine/threonine protein kinase n=1 Tax=Marivita hallyeonensis TaxID=996342 RepID=A0A1M5RXZ7_9RHOB|nr:serine/threonine-protein kinase [Marivita hallyeonensis]SHH31054.1 Serine/threonine protein kinase [Marivita hallyeonensis]